MRPLLAPLVALILLAALPAAAVAQDERPVFRVLAFGDSYGSGEGAPAVPGFYGANGSDTGSPSPAANWAGSTADRTFTGDSATAARRCHRSPLATAPRAVRRLQADFPEVNFTFRSFACSGARIDEGVLGSYEGAEPADEQNRVPSQVSAANEYLGDLPSDRRVDALLMNIGGNNLGFANVIQRCLNLPPFPFEPCSPPDFSDGGAGNQDTRNVVLNGQGSGEDPAVIGLDDLPGLYRDLDDVIDRRADFKLRHVPGRVFLTSPPNPLAGGLSGCAGLNRDDDHERNLRADESTWLQTEILPLMVDAMDEAAEDRGWEFVDMRPAILSGLCGPAPRGINRNRDALPAQGATVANVPAGFGQPGLRVSHGIAHPNASGYESMAPLLALAMRPWVIEKHTPARPGGGAPALVDQLRQRVELRVDQTGDPFRTRPAAVRPAPGTGLAVGGLGFASVEVPVTTTPDRMSIDARRCGPLAPTAIPPAGCGALRTIADVRTGTPGVPTGVSVARDPLGLRVRWTRGSRASLPLRRFMVVAEMVLDRRVDPVETLAGCSIEDDPRFGGDGPLTNGRPCGSRAAIGDVRAPVRLTFDAPPDARETVIPVATNGDWRVSVRECTDRGCAAPAGNVRARSGLTPLARELQEALSRPPVVDLRGLQPVGLFTTLAGRRARAGGPFPLRVAWAAWRSLRELRALRVRLVGGEELATIDVDLRSAGLVLRAPGGSARRGRVGRRGTLSAPRLSLDAGRARIVRSGPAGRLVALELPLRLARALRGRRVDVEIGATSRSGRRQAPARGGSFAVG